MLLADLLEVVCRLPQADRRGQSPTGVRHGLEDSSQPTLRVALRDRLLPDQFGDAPRRGAADWAV